MSKYIKYISSKHFGAPQLKGDRWGYCVEMLRTCLVEGFNQRNDLNKFEVISKDKVKFTFTTEHNYTQYQTIKISNIAFPELNGDFLVDEFDSNTVTCKSYTDLSSIIGLINTNLNASSIVSPLGFKEKFRDGNRSVFVTDEETEKSYFYIDDREVEGTTWKDANGNTRITAPIVFMAEKMTDIDTVTSKNIFPFDSLNPTFYKDRDYVDSTSYRKHGIFNFITYTQHSSSSYPNTPTKNILPIDYTIIGNGRFFYFLPDLSSATYPSYSQKIYGFGKVKTVNEDTYLLIGDITGNTESFYSISRLYNALPITNSNILASTSNPKTDWGNVFYGLLNVNNRSSSCIFSPTHKIIKTLSLISGLQENYPNDYSGKFYISPISIFVNYNYYAKLSGLMWTFNSNEVYFKNKSIKKFNNKLLYTYNTVFLTGSPVLTTSSVSRNIYVLSLDYIDWNNYE